MGVLKLGHRQRAAALIRRLASEHARHEVEAGAGPAIGQATTSAAPNDRVTAGEATAIGVVDDFWNSIAASSLEATSAGTLDTCDPRFAMSEECATRGAGVHVIEGQGKESLLSSAAVAMVSGEVVGESHDPDATMQQHLTVPTERERSEYEGVIREDRAEICRQRGNAAFERRDLAAAARWYERALEARPGDASATNNLAACSIMATPPRPAEALARLRPLLTSDAACDIIASKARVRAGRACVMLGRLQEALSHFDAALAIDKRLAAEARGGAVCDEPRWAPPVDAVASAAGASELKRLGGPAAPPDVSVAREGRSKASKLMSHVARARSLAEQGRADEALYLARSVARDCTHSALGPMLILSILEGAGRLWDAQREAEEAIESVQQHVGDGDNMDVCALRIAHARLLSLRGRVDEGEAALALLVAQHPDHASAAAQLRGLRSALAAKRRGNGAYSSGNYEAAAAAYSEGLASDEAGFLRVLLLGNRAQARLQAGRHAEALHDVDLALKLEPSSVKLLLRRAACLLPLGRVEQARSAFAKALAEDRDCEAAASGVRECDERLRRCSRAGREARSADAAEAVEEAFDPYAVLDLPQNASAAQIKQAFRKAALRWHPDKFAAKEGVDDAQRAEAEERFREINTAHDVLSDPVQKRQYDLGGGLGRGARRAPAYSTAA
eukprot:scaffold200868_cov35-Tisochrysis_lutea.AAC.1